MESNEQRARAFKIIVDQKLHEWHEQYITGAQIKVLAGVDPSFGVWQDVPGPIDPPVQDDQKVDLGKPGVEKFFTGKKTTTEGRG
jgi:hypothetical protein